MQIMLGKRLAAQLKFENMNSEAYTCNSNIAPAQCKEKETGTPETKNLFVEKAGQMEPLPG